MTRDRGRRLAFVLTLGQTHDTQGFAPLIRMIPDRLDAVLADMGYDADAVCDELASADIEAVISAKNKRHHSAPLARRGRAPVLQT
ncbi:transposase [Sphingomonas sp. PL-96]|uniref:transposase n=1 Tax=Sphingomonas sp. PL-96 TaxID=2887201 RepID=UPI00226C9503|nr:transposase [Sphingomonas sp. PL-96]MCC2978257.1 transposase [Sphingomonas sp. PL-96]